MFTVNADLLQPLYLSSKMYQRWLLCITKISFSKLSLQFILANHLSGRYDMINTSPIYRNFLVSPKLSINHYRSLLAYWQPIFVYKSDRGTFQEAQFCSGIPIPVHRHPDMENNARWGGEQTWMLIRASCLVQLLQVKTHWLMLTQPRVNISRQLPKATDLRMSLVWSSVLVI